ncbi:MAG: hypothetical protein PHG64_15415 [Paludibacter sp.]|jgi:hypothetical protein|nr:hypothetical protein [Paludibacter sp.]
MKHITADDGRILTPPKESEPLLKDAFPAFYKLLGHIRFFYVADEIWDGKSSLVFKTGGKQLAAITLGDGSFEIEIADEDFRIGNDTELDDIYRALKKHATVNQCRPYDQLTIDPNGCPCGWRCDLCLGSKNCDEKNFTASENFGYMNWVCYHDCIPEKVERFDGVFKCPGCKAIRTNKGVWKDWEGCKAFICLSTKEYVNCVECGEYHSCDVFNNCHHPAQCNLGITAEEITKLVIPYATKERLDYYRSQLSGVMK